MTGRSPTSPSLPKSSTPKSPTPKSPAVPGTAGSRSGVIGRRALLTGAGAGGIAAAVVAAAGGAVPEPAAEPEATERDPVYRETEHIRQFYARSRF